VTVGCIGLVRVPPFLGAFRARAQLWRFWKAAGHALVVWALGYAVDFRVAWLSLTRRMAGSSVDSCSFRAMLRMLVLSIQNVPFVFLTSKEPIHIRLGVRDGELNGVLSGHREACVGDATTTARSTSSGGLMRCDWAWKHTAIFAVMLFSSISGNLLSMKTIFSDDLF